MKYPRFDSHFVRKQKQATVPPCFEIILATNINVNSITPGEYTVLTYLLRYLNFGLNSASGVQAKGYRVNDILLHPRQLFQ